MDLFKSINEDAKSDAGEKHIKDERKRFTDCADYLKDLVEFVDSSKTDADDAGRKSDYESIARKARVLMNELQKHLERYE